MTPDKARRSELSFGLAVKYTSRDRDAIETLYALNDYPVQCAIKNRLGQASCEQPAEVEPGRPRGSTPQGR